jgi:hypothetical protein
MIEGLLSTVNAPELQLLCLKRADQHRASADQLAKDLTTPQRKKKNRRREPSYPAEETQILIDRHLNKAQELEFIANHLEMKEQYRLNRDELCELGIIAAESDFAPSNPYDYDPDDIPF